MIREISGDILLSNAFIRPTGVQSAAFAELCPSVTVERGKPGNSDNERHAAKFIDACLQPFLNTFAPS